MVEILLVDDEPFFIRDLRKTLARIGGPYRVAAEAYDVSDALRKLQSFNLDIAFIDIRMPGITGLVLVREIRKSFPWVIPVILSGFQDFELVREALRAEAEDYLLKPVEEATLAALLESLSCKALDARRRFQASRLSGLLGDEAARTPEAPGIKAFQRFQLISVPERGRSGEGGSVLAEIGSLLGEGEQMWILDGAPDESLALLGLNRTDDRGAVRMAEEAILALPDDVPPTAAAVSHGFEKIGELGRVYHELRSLKDCCAVLGPSRAVIVDSGERARRTALYDAMEAYFESGFRCALAARDRAAFESTLRNALRRCEREGIPKMLIKRQLFKLTLMAEKYLESRTFPEEGRIQDLLDEMADRARDGESLTADFSALLGKAFVFEGGVSLANDQAFFRLVEDFMEANVMKRMDVGTVCSRLSVSQTKLNRIVKKHTGMPFVEYSTCLKIEKAKEILRERDDLSIGELAYSLGYNDNLYFSKVFRRLASMTPSQYRDSVRRT